MAFSWHCATSQSFIDSSNVQAPCDGHRGRGVGVPRGAGGRGRGRGRDGGRGGERERAAAARHPRQPRRPRPRQEEEESPAAEHEAAAQLIQYIIHMLSFNIVFRYVMDSIVLDERIKDLLTIIFTRKPELITRTSIRFATLQ